MKIDIHAKNIELSNTLSEMIKKKVSKLGILYNQIIDTAVYLHEEGHNVKEVQLKVNIKNQTLVCKERHETFESALDMSVDAMKKQILKYKEK
jgi:putative sigma-54 modulation protein